MESQSKKVDLLNEDRVVLKLAGLEKNGCMRRAKAG